MNAVVGLTDAILHQKKYPELEAKLQLIQGSAEKVVRLVDDTLKHTKLEHDAVELNLREASPADVVTTVHGLWEASAQQNGTQLVYNIDPSVPDKLVFDDFQYEQCLNNLVGNAVKFTENGVIQIIMAVKGEGDAAQLILAVRDTGIGMSPEQVKTVFEAFKQADPTISSRFGGTGLGMSITKSIIEMMGGKISVKSEEGKGSVFITAIPLDQKSQKARYELALKAERSTDVKPAPARSPKNSSNYEQPTSENKDRSETEVAPEGKRRQSSGNTPFRPFPQPETQDSPFIRPRASKAPVDTSAASQPARPVSESKTSSASNGSTSGLPPKTARTKPISSSGSDEDRFGHLDILIVDDNATNHLVVGSLLENVVGSIDTAMNGEEAIAALDRRADSGQPMYDLVLMDIHMPIMDGIEATLAIRSNPSAYEEIPIIALTADPQYQQSRLCKNIGMNEALAKPIKLKQLLKAFGIVLGQSAGSVAA